MTLLIHMIHISEGRSIALPINTAKLFDPATGKLEQYQQSQRWSQWSHGIVATRW